MLTMLSNFSSLWEVFTAFYCSMLIDNILGFIWTPPYKKNVKGLILNMGIPFVEILSEKLSHQLEENFNGINSHMKKKAIFMEGTEKPFKLVRLLDYLKKQIAYNR